MCNLSIISLVDARSTYIYLQGWSQEDLFLDQTSPVFQHSDGSYVPYKRSLMRQDDNSREFKNRVVSLTSKSL